MAIYKLLSSLCPTNLNEVQLYEVPSDTELIGLLHICNQNTNSSFFSVALTYTPIAATVSDWISFEEILYNNTTHLIGPINLNAGQTIRIKAGIANKISFVLTGLIISI